MNPWIESFGRDLVLHASSVMRSMQTHGPGNAAAQSALDRLWGHLESGRPALGGEVQLQLVDDYLLINGSRVRATTSQAPYFTQVGTLLGERGLGGVAFAEDLRPEALREFFGLFAGRAPTEEERPALREAFAALAPAGVRPLPLRTLTIESAPELLRVATMAFALQTYARTLLGFREFVESLRQGRNPYRNRLSVVRAVQDLVDVANARTDLLLYVVALERARRGAHGRPALDVHATHTAIYALMIGLLLRFDRTALLDLGTAALLAEAGTALLGLDDEPATVLDANGVEARRLRLIQAAQVLLGEERTDDAILLRVVTAYEHRRPLVEAEAEGRPPHLASRIVAVAAAYDAMTSDRPWRPAMSPEAALAALEAERGLRFDATVVAALATLIRYQRAGGFGF